MTHDHLPCFREMASLHREERSIVCRFAQPVSVLSTSRRHGGLGHNITAAINYQICESGQCPTCKVCLEGLDDYLDQHAAQLGCDPARTVTMLTSAGMENAGWATESHGGVDVLSVVTAGVSTNAARAGDRATHYEGADGWHPAAEAPPAGTINLILLINHQLTLGALVKAGIMATEAKSATLQALDVRSIYSHGIATGTGTDQYVLACPQESPFVLTEAQAHVVLGQMIADTVSAALRTAVARENELTLATRRSVRAQLMRFGGDVDAGDRDGDLAAVAAAAALAAVIERLEWGTFPAAAAPRLLARHAAALARALSGDTLSVAEAEERLLSSLQRRPEMPFRDVIDLALAIAKG